MSEDKQKIQGGDNPAPGVLEGRQRIWSGRPVQPGDKMAGRHGNSGVVVGHCRLKICHTIKTASRWT